MSNRKALFLTGLIDTLFFFVVVYLHEYAMHIYSWFRVFFLLLGWWYFIALTYRFIVTPDRPSSREVNRRH